MIRLVSRFEYEPICDPNYIKIAASATAYGTGKPFCMVWRQGETLICRIDGNMTLYGQDFDGDEVKSFINAVGTNTLTCSVDAAEKLGLPFERFYVLKATKGIQTAADFSPSCDTVYNLLSEGDDGSIALPERTSFIADLSHRTRHGTAAACVYKSSVCVAPYITDDGALICGVATEKQSRGSGFAGICVAALVNHINRPTFVICEPQLVPFYKKFGFTDWGENAKITF